MTIKYYYCVLNLPTETVYFYMILLLHIIHPDGEVAKSSLCGAGFNGPMAQWVSLTAN